MKRSLLGSALLLMVTAPMLAAPIGSSAWITPTLLPGGVADAAGKTGFLANDKNAVEAVDLATGAVLWTAEVPGKPLIVAGNRLAVQVPLKGKGNGVRVVLLDLDARGKQVGESEPVVFPDWVAVGLAGGRSFASSAKVHNNDLLLSWKASAWYWGGTGRRRKSSAAAQGRFRRGPRQPRNGQDRDARRR